MQNKVFIGIGAVLLIVIVILLFIQPKLSPSIQDVSCNALSAQNKDGINLVFFASEEQTKRYSSLLLQTLPFADYKSKFNIYYIKSDPDCELYKDVALFCYSRNTVKQASACPNDYVIVLRNQPINIRSSAYENVISVNTQSQDTTLAHEFGHAFANLAEEYTPARLPSNSLNCVADCKDFKGEKDGCFEGCSKDNYYRSINSGIMRTLYAKRFGIYNEKLIEERLTQSKSKITGNVISDSSSCSNQNYFLISGEIKNGQIELKDKEVAKGCAGSNGFGEYSLNVKDAQDNVLYTEQFNPSLIFTDIQETGMAKLEGETYIREGTFYIRVPVINEATKVEVYNPESQQTSSIIIHSLSSYACKIE